MRLRLLFILMLLLRYSVFTMGQIGGSDKQIEKAKRDLHLTFDLRELLNKTHEERWPMLYLYYMDFIPYQSDSSSILRLLNELDSIAIVHSDDDLRTEVIHLLEHFRQYNSGLTHKEKVDRIIENWQKSIASGKQWEKFLTTYQLVYRCCMRDEEPEVSFRAIAFGKRMLKSGYNHPQKAYFLILAATQYYRYNDLNNAKKNSLLALRAMEEKNTVLTEYNNFSGRLRLGLIYQEMGELDSSDHYLNEALDFLKTTSLEERELFTADVYRFIGKNEYLRGNYDKALMYLEANTDSLPSATGTTWLDGNNGISLLRMADIFLRKGDIASAKKMLDRGELLIRNSPDHEKVELLYETKASYAAQAGAKRLHIAYSDSAKMFADSLARYKLLLSRIPAEIEAELQDLEAAHEDAHEVLKWYRSAYWMLALALTIMVAMAGLYTYYARNKEISLLQTLSAEKATSEQLAVEVTQIKHRIEKDDEFLSGRLVTEEAWMVFMEKFAVFRSDFMEAFNRKHGLLSKAEKRLCYLTYLGLTDTEIASRTGVSENTVRVNRSRVKKKMGLDKRVDLNLYLRSQL